MKKIRLVLNGKASDNFELRQAVSALRSEGHQIDVRVTWEAGDATRYALDVASDDQTIVLAGGGDGTVNEVLNGLLQADNLQATLGIIPFGTANDFATSAGIPIGNPLAALRLALSEPPIPIDAIRMNDRYFLNVASGGFGAEVTSSTSSNLKKIIGGAAYSLTALVMAMHARPYRGKLITPDKTIVGEMVMMAIGNGRQAGGGANMTPHAYVNDGLMDLMVVPFHEKDRFAHLIMELAELKEQGGEHFHYLRLNECRIESEGDLQFNLDGEPAMGRTFDFKVLPEAVKFVMPAGSPLLS